MGGDLVLFWLTASAMAALTAWLVKKGAEVETLHDASVLLFLLAMMASMFASAVDYLYYPGFYTLVVLLILNMVSMSVLLVPILAVWLVGDRKLEDMRRGSRPSARTIVGGSVIALVILSEVFMGWTFAILGGSLQGAASGGTYSAIVSSTSSYWFLFTMAGEMAVTLFMLRKSIPRDVWWIVGAQAAIMFLSPTAIPDPSWARFSTYAGSSVMVVLFVYIFEFLYRNRVTSPWKMGYIVRVMLAYALMMAGVFVWLLEGDPVVFALSVIVEMAVYFSVALRSRGLGAAPQEGWQSRPFWVFAMLGLLFVAEFFMGGVIDIYAFGTGYFTGLPLAAVGLSVASIPGAFYDFVVLFSSVTASAWYLIMMGIEMGALVLFKIGHTREFETKVRLGMVIGAYAIYAVFLPYFVFPASAQQVPWVGWSMGVGTAGALGPDVLLALLASYFVSGILSFLFGSRNVCSLF